MYVKLFTSIYQGTLRGNPTGLLVFTNLLAHADKDGFVDIHPRAISEEVGLSVDDVRAALSVLESPDDESRSPEEQGRRIMRIDEHRAWGWRIVNYVKYREIRNTDDRREQNRLAQARFRNKSKPPSAMVSHDKPQSAHADAEVYADTEVMERRRGSRLPKDFEPKPEPEAERGIDRQKELANFRDYWTAKSGKDATKLDWQATWRTWARKAYRRPEDMKNVTVPGSDAPDPALAKLTRDAAMAVPPPAEIRERMKQLTKGTV